VGRETAFAASMVLWAVTFAACALAGVPILLKEGFSLGELRHMREQEEEQIDSAMLPHSAEAGHAAEPSE